MTDAKLLLVGASGFVGRAVVRRAVRHAGFRLIAGVRTPAGLPPGTAVCPVDVTATETLTAALRDIRPSVVINAAAYGVRPGQTDSGAALRVNVAGATALLEAAASAGCRRFIQLGSCSEYGARDGTVHEDDSPTPHTLYGATKAAGSIMVLERGAACGIETAVLRLFNLWGAGEPGHRLFPSIVEAARTRTPVDLTDGTQIKDYSFVDDVADWILELACAPPGAFGTSGIVNVGSGRPEPLRDWAARLADRLGARHLLRFGAKPNRADEPKGQIPDLGRLEALLPGRTRTPMDAALERALAVGVPAMEESA
jgi:nucleoside-diphosphate-sugar epimerase